MKRNLLDLVLERGFKMQYRKVLACTLWMLFIFTPISSANGEALKRLEPVSLAVVDFRGVLAKSDASRNIRSQVDKKRLELKRHFSEIENKLRTEQQALAKQRSIVTAEAFEKRARKLKDKTQVAQKRAQESNRLLKRSFDASMDKVQKELLRIVAEVAEESGAGIVLFRSAIVIAVKKLEISQEVLKRLNKRLPKLKVVFEAAKGS